MRCQWCGKDDDRVVDSRLVDAGGAVRRRRECRSCGRRYTTFERVEDIGLMVAKRGGDRHAYDREKVVAGIQKAIKNRPVNEDQVARIAEHVEQRLRRKGPEVTSQDVGVEVLRQLGKVDQVAYLRFASVYKDFQGLTDFERELGVLQKKEPAKGRRS
ncbi:MAG: transcriptional regulator NrdR [Actinomycetota bacterium]